MADRFAVTAPATMGFAPSSVASRGAIILNKLLALITRGFLDASSYRLNFIGTYFGGVLYVVFYALLARFIGKPPAGVQAYGDYFTYLLIGSTFVRYLSLGMKHFSRELEKQMVAGTIEPLVATATSPAFALLGVSAWILVEGVLVMLLELAVGVFVFKADLARANWPAAIALAVLTLVALNSWGVISAAFVVVFKRADPLNWFVDLTAFIFCGVYFPVTLLPIWLRVVSYALPLTYAIEGLRGALMQGRTLGESGTHALILIAFDLLLIPTSIAAFRYALAYTRRTGSLGHY
ncbi:MAG: ABC transporter permease [Chloroflexi bacterium]|nr:ABC transporter permease [Chloroflexota bacterium]